VPPCRPTGPEDQLQLWQQALGTPAATRLGPALDITAGEFRLSADDIRTGAPRLARQLLTTPDPGAALRQACRSRRRLQLGGLAQPIEALAGWDELILPDAPASCCARSPPRCATSSSSGSAGASPANAPGHLGAVCRRARHRQDDGRRGAGPPNSASTSSASTCRR
jgi:hypothetical protein